MSRASAYVRTPLGEHVAHGIYDGTSDVLDPCLTETRDQAWDYYYNRWERPDGRNAWDVVRECEHELEVGYAYSDYGGGFYWPVRFCRVCMVVHGPLDWDSMYDLVQPANGYWPKDGEPPIHGTAREVEHLLLPKGRDA